MTDLRATGLPEGFVAPDARCEPATFVSFLEGPACALDGTVYFTDIAGNRIMHYDPRTGKRSVFREPSGRANGLLFDTEQRLIACEGNEHGDNDGGRRMTRTDLDTGEIEILTDRFHDHRYNAPNDVAVCSNGWIFFTDPCYGDRSTMETEHESVYRIDPDGSVQRVLTQPEIERPNGIALSPDEQTMYLVDSNSVVGGAKSILAFDLTGEGTLENRRVVYDFAPGRGGDGMAVDQQGTLYVAGGIARPRGDFETDEVPPGVWVMSPQGELHGRLPIPEDTTTNVTFGGQDLRTLYVTAGKTLYTVRVETPGFVIHRKP